MFFSLEIVFKGRLVWCEILLWVSFEILNYDARKLIQNRLNEIKKLQSKGEYRTPPVRMDEKDFGIGAQILHDLKIHKIRLLTNSTQIKRVGMVGYGLEIVEYINY